MRRLLLVALAAGLLAAPVQAQTSAAMANGLRGATPLDSESRPPLLPKNVNDDQRKARNYPMQPPLIPHQIDNYQVDVKFNKCMSCHGRDKVGESQAPMVSVTHYQDRDGNMRNEISPRRYFCTQCHVAQTDARAPVKNTFQDFYGTAASPPRKGAGK